VLVGTGLDSTRATIALTRKVADLGADAVLVLTPHYYKPQMTAEALRRHFVAVADASPVPVYLYSMTLFTAGKVVHTQADAREVYDVSGAGDTVIATVATMLGAGVPLIDSIAYANRAAGIVVGKLGTATVDYNELFA